jgi:16S rRNA processing protein RimM
MSSFKGDTEQSLVGVARAVRTRGLKGEIVAELLTDFPERFDSIDKLVALSPTGDRKTVELEDFWFQSDRVILKLANCNSVEEASEFIGFEFCIKDAERVPLAQDEYYDFELEGCAAELMSGESIGIVQRILKTGGAPILVIVTGTGGEVLVPLAESIVVDIDTEGKRIVIDPPEGLLELS